MDETFWNERYSQPEYVYGTDPNTFLQASISHFPTTGCVLCLAEGEGRNALFLAQQGYEVWAVDISASGKEKAEKLAREHGVSFEYIVANVNDFDFGEKTWDVIVSISAHTDPNTRKRVYRKSLKGLKENGIFILESYHPKQLQYETGGPKNVEWLVTLNDLIPYFSGQQIIHQRETERDVREGTFHTGKAFVTQFICKKISS
ncbi:class I SAM-dependent methyltransferase [Candidatus Nitronereus thalassa]|uniref:Class I SAM-dependent methyltransferase n=1 Tax=Candidatus Nitronereus thalassa TaxID=3020898 RepID=A0ABU3KBK3_9BACT|nr:class I SAM-dependent methyltransferase [Candidatus Nitronereus thalassa]MDT7043614.1 class I SAM-dependent methyltransferase [Candidatus Nitronereus thalassa]